MAKKDNQKKTVKHHLTDKERKQVYAMYIECGNMSEVGRKFDISPTAVRNIIQKADGSKTSKLLKEKRDNNNIEVARAMETNVKKLREIIVNGMDKMQDLVNDADGILISLRDVSGATKISSDILFKMQEMQLKEKDHAIKVERLELEKKIYALREREMLLKESEFEFRKEVANNKLGDDHFDDGMLDAIGIALKDKDINSFTELVEPNTFDKKKVSEDE